MPFHRTSTVTISTATVAVDEFGDDEETWTVSASGVGAHIHEHTSKHYEPTTQTWVVSRGLRAFLDPGTVAPRGARITDDAGRVATVTHVYEFDESPIGVIPTRVELDRVS